MQVTKRGVFIAYINVLLISAIVTLAVVKLVADQDTAKRQHYVDVMGIACDPALPNGVNTTCGEFGQCKPLFPEQPSGDHICVCDDGYTHFDGICDYKRLPQFNAFMASFFGGSVGADWYVQNSAAKTDIFSWPLNFSPLLL